MSTLFSSILARPVPGYTAHAGPGIVRYEDLLSIVYPTLYSSASWPSTAQLLAELEKGNATMALERAAANSYTYEPDSKPHKLSTDGTGWPGIEKKTTKSEELGDMVVCADSYDAQSQPMEWWAELQRNMTQK